MKIFSHGILGMNARNLRYIRAHNSLESMSLADSKLHTKELLSSRGVPFAQTYAEISSHQGLLDFSFDLIFADGFVIKPNNGSGGRGILIVKKSADGYFVQGEEWSEDQLRFHMTDVMRGSFSLHAGFDTVIIEELLTPGADFGAYCEHGLADIRLIVYNYIPVAAMIRMPTIHSHGKANLAQGGIGLGLNVASGQVVSCLHNGVTHTYEFPLEYSELRMKTLPFWDDILLYSSQVQMYTKLGYLALDWVITSDGPKLLEINARAGLEIQNVNLVPLAARLRKIEDLKVLSPEKGVEIAKALFQTDTMIQSGSKKVLFLTQEGRLDDKPITISLDMTRAQSLVSHDIVSPALPRITMITESGVRISLDVYALSHTNKRSIVLGTNDMQGYLIDPILPLGESENIHTSRNRWSSEILELDDEVYRLSKKLNLSSLLRPENYSCALDEFIGDPHGYNPTFSYRFPSVERLNSLEESLKRLKDKAQKIRQSGEAIAPLYSEKLDELSHRRDLVCAYRDQDFERIFHCNQALFGDTRSDLLSLSREKVLEGNRENYNPKEILGEELSCDQIISSIQSYFETYNLPLIPISLDSQTFSRMSISYGREIKIHLSKNACIQEGEIDAILSHEIGTHFRRYLAGKEQGLKLFQFGTGYYLRDEEGFAIYQSFQHLPDDYQKNAMFIKYYLLDAVDMISFADTIDLLRLISPHKSLESIFAGAVRLKRGMVQSGVAGVRGTTYQKDKIYLDGYTCVKSWIDQGGDTNDLFFGKIKLQDLALISHLPQ